MRLALAALGDTAGAADFDYKPGPDVDLSKAAVGQLADVAPVTQVR